MPELPEVETIRRQLAPALEGRRIEHVEILDPRFTRPAPPGEVAAGLDGRVIERLARAGKYLIWQLSGERFLLVHLRMTGALLLNPASEPPHTRMRVALEGGQRLIYNDPRRFGTGHLLEGEAAMSAYLGARLGIEPLTPEFTAAHLRSLARGRRAPIKSFILDQRRIAGVGNIYADEALHRARIHPLRPAGALTRAQSEALREAIEHALASGIDAKGATIDDFRHIDGASGSFQDRFQVHQREGFPCPVCGTEIRKLFVGGRGTYVCERCQPRPRARRG
ncbi:MAG: bifunctional DNA-formamidopyrimidine glycosylase/DNA-(apurinic or apyrimidinic site) lyase [Solirubrobacteraceae bacterium]